MAAVTQIAPSIDPKVTGNIRMQFYSVTVVTTGDTLTVPGMSQIYFVGCTNPAGITNISFSGNTVTFTGTATAAAVVVMGN